MVLAAASKSRLHRAAMKVVLATAAMRGSHLVGTMDLHPAVMPHRVMCTQAVKPPSPNAAKAALCPTVPRLTTPLHAKPLTAHPVTALQAPPLLRPAKPAAPAAHRAPQAKGARSSPSVRAKVGLTADLDVVC